MKEQKRNQVFEKKIIECIQKNYSFYTWKSLNGVVEKCELKGKAIRLDYNEIELEVRDNQNNQVEKLISGDRKVSIYIAEMAMSFQAQLKSVNPDGKLKIVIPEDFAIHERRKHERINPRKSCYVSLEIKSQLFRKAIYDISIGGFAIILPKTEKHAVTKENLNSVAILELEGVKVKIRTKVICTSFFSFDRYKYSELPYGGIKVSFSFKEISEESKNVLREFIVTELLSQNVSKKAN
jgi:hypothetical protein